MLNQNETFQLKTQGGLMVFWELKDRHKACAGLVGGSDSRVSNPTTCR